MARRLMTCAPTIRDRGLRGSVRQDHSSRRARPPARQARSDGSGRRRDRGAGPPAARSRARTSPASPGPQQDRVSATDAFPVHRRDRPASPPERTQGLRDPSAPAMVRNASFPGPCARTLRTLRTADRGRRSSLPRPRVSRTSRRARPRALRPSAAALAPRLPRPTGWGPRPRRSRGPLDAVRRPLGAPVGPPVWSTLGCDHSPGVGRGLIPPPLLRHPPGPHDDAAPPASPPPPPGARGACSLTLAAALAAPRGGLRRRLGVRESPTCRRTVPPSASAPRPRPGATACPEGWEVLPPAPMRELGLRGRGPRDATCTFAILPGTGGGLARERQPLAQADVARAPDRGADRRAAAPTVPRRAIRGGRPRGHLRRHGRRASRSRRPACSA